MGSTPIAGIFNEKQNLRKCGHTDAAAGVFYTFLHRKPGDP